MANATSLNPISGTNSGLVPSANELQHHLNAVNLATVPSNSSLVEEHPLVSKQADVVGTSNPTAMISQFIKKLAIGVGITLLITAAVALTWTFASFCFAAAVTAIAVGVVVFGTMKARQLINEMKEHINLVSKCNDDLKSQNETLSKQSEQLSTDLKKCEETLSSAELNAENAQAELEESIRARESETKSYQSALSEKDGVIAAKDRQLQHQVQELNKANAQAEDMQTQLRSRIEQDQEMHIQVQRVIQDQKCAISALREQLMLDSDKSEIFLSTQVWANGRINSISTEMSAGIRRLEGDDTIPNDKKFPKILQICTRTTQQLSDFQMELFGRLHEDQIKVETMISHAQEKLEEVSMQNTVMQERLAQSDRELADAQEKFEYANAQYQESLRELEGKKQELVDEQSSLLEQTEHARSEQEKAQLDARSAQGKLDAAQRSLANARADIQRLRIEHSQAQQSVKSMQKTIEQQKSTIADQESEIQKLEKKRQQLQRHVATGSLLGGMGGLIVGAAAGFVAGKM